MSVTMEKTVRDLALENPAAIGIFEQLGIDYCCGGGRTLEQACRGAKVPAERVLETLATAGRKADEGAAGRDWQAATLGELVEHIRNTHHEYVRGETARFAPLFDKVVKAHGANHPELAEMRETFSALAEELSSHLMKEEMVLFPYIVRLEGAASVGTPAPTPPFGSVRNPVAMMIHEHDGAGEALRSLRLASNGYAAPADGCVSLLSLYRGLADFEADLHQHIHLENNILFPRAIALEQTFGK
jgi:regulator of cell morphogenesis and NO signaling